MVRTHNQTAFPAFPTGRAPLARAGHTHCGQVALPDRPHWAYLALTSVEKIVAGGWAPKDYGAPGNRMFVTCGIGFSLFPVRINAPPPVALFELEAADRDGAMSIPLQIPD